MSNAIRLPRGRIPIDATKRSLYLKKAADANHTTMKAIEEFIKNGAGENAPYTPAHKFKKSKKQNGPSIVLPMYRESYVEIIDGINGKLLILSLTHVIGARPLANGAGVSILCTDDTGESSEIDSPESYESFKARLATVATVLAAPNIPMVENSSEPVEVVGSIESSGIIV